MSISLDMYLTNAHMYVYILRLMNGEASSSPEIVLNLLQSSAFRFWHTFSRENDTHYRDDTEEQEGNIESIGILLEDVKSQTRC